MLNSLKQWFKILALLVALVACGLQEPAPTTEEAVDPKAVATNGLTGVYYDNMDFTGITKTRVDATINKTFGTAAPIAGIAATTYSVRWTGQIMPAFSQTYTFYLTSSDGARLMVNGQVIVNDWVDGASRVRSGTVALVANTKYDIRLEYYRNATNASTVKLEWQSASRARQVVPTGNLFPIISSVVGAKQIPYTISSDMKNWTSILSNQRTFVYQAQGSVDVSWAGAKFYPVYLLNNAGEIVCADIIIPGQKETLEFSPRTAADYLVINSPVFLGWREKARLELYGRIRQESRFGSLEQKLRVTGGNIFAQDAIDLADQIAQTLANTRIAEVKTQYNISSQKPVSPRKIDQNFPNGIPPYAGYANLVQTLKQFKVQNKSLMNWHVFRVLQSDYVGETPDSLAAHGRQADCETPESPKCYQLYSVNDTFNTPGIPVVDLIIAANAFPAETEPFTLPSCDKYNVVLSATHIHSASLTDSGVQNIVAVLNTLFEFSDGFIPRKTMDAAPTVVIGQILQQMNFFVEFQQLVEGVRTASADNRSASIENVKRYVFQTIISLINTGEILKLYEINVPRIDLVSKNMSKRFSVTSALYLLGFLDNLAYLTQYAVIFVNERLRGGLPNGVVSYDKKGSLKVTPLEVSDVKGSNDSGNKMITLENPSDSECPVTYSYNLVTTNNTGVNVSTALLPLGSTALSNTSGRLKPIEVAAIQLNYTCPTQVAKFTGYLEVTSDDPVNPRQTVNVSLQCYQGIVRTVRFASMDWRTPFGGFVGIGNQAGWVLGLDVVDFVSNSGGAERFIAPNGLGIMVTPYDFVNSIGVAFSETIQMALKNGKDQAPALFNLWKQHIKPSVTILSEPRVYNTHPKPDFSAWMTGGNLTADTIDDALLFVVDVLVPSP